MVERVDAGVQDLPVDPEESVSNVVGVEGVLGVVEDVPSTTMPVHHHLDVRVSGKGACEFGEPVEVQRARAVIGTARDRRQRRGQGPYDPSAVLDDTSRVGAVDEADGGPRTPALPRRVRVDRRTVLMGELRHHLYAGARREEGHPVHC